MKKSAIRIMELVTGAVIVAVILPHILKRIGIK